MGITLSFVIKGAMDNLTYDHSNVQKKKKNSLTRAPRSFKRIRAWGGGYKKEYAKLTFQNHTLYVFTY